MKFVRAINTPDPERAPALFSLLADASFVTETRLYDWNVRQEGTATALFEVDGDRDRFRAELVDVPGVKRADTTPVTDGLFTLLLVIEPAAILLLRNVLGTLTREGLVVAKPIVYRDGQVHARIVGSAAVLQTVFDDLPSEMDVEVVTVGDFDRQREAPLSTLSDRQREALLVAFDLGYYEQPRRSTHEDVAARLDCAPNTASEHLQKAEAKLVRAATTRRGW